jgi:hypothetical protein
MARREAQLLAGTGGDDEEASITSAARSLADDMMMMLEYDDQGVRKEQDRAAKSKFCLGGVDVDVDAEVENG